MTEQSHAVFLSYASQDAEAAEKICEALRAAGIEVFFDQSELQGGDAWDQKIRHEIQDCALFVPIVSQHTQERHEGYFRREWKLAVDRTHDMAEQKPFLVPVVIDSTQDQGAIVPDLFRTVQWTRLPTGDTPAAFVERIRRLVSLEVLPTISSPPLAMSTAAPAIGRSIGEPWRSKRTLLVVSAALAAVLTYVVVDEFRISRSVTASAVTSATSVPDNAVRFSPPPHSIAVLPFVNMSGDPHQEYFSDGLTEELLNSLSRINELQVAARTSSFSFQGEHPDIATVGHKLNVASVLEGSVRRSGHTIRITAQLIDAVTGFHLWSEIYDRDQGDVLQLQTDIANAVAGALKVALLGDVAGRIEVGGTHNSAAFDAYLRAARGHVQHSGENMRMVIAEYTEAIRLDPNYALAFAARSTARAQYAMLFAKGVEIRTNFDNAEADARQAIALAPSLAEAYLALALVFAEGMHDFTQASKAYSRAQMLAPGNALVLRDFGRFGVLMGQTELGLTALRRALVLDPLNQSFHVKLGDALMFARRFDEAIAAFQGTLALDPENLLAYADLGLAYYGRGDMESARKSCEIKSSFEQSQVCLAVSYEKLGRHADAQAVLTKLQGERGEDAAYQYAEIYAQWNDPAESLHWLEVAVRLHDSGLVLLRVDPLMDPLREEPRFEAIERELKFPN